MSKAGLVYGWWGLANWKVYAPSQGVNQSADTPKNSVISRGRALPVLSLIIFSREVQNLDLGGKFHFVT